MSAGKRIEKDERAKKEQQVKTQKSQDGLEIKLKRMELPTFDGDLRNYARFKYQFDKFVKPALKNDDDAIFVLKNECLEKNAKEHVRNIDDDLDEIWRRLDDRFGRPEITTRAILADLKQLSQVPEGDSFKFIKLADTVERCFKDLERIGMEREITNATIVGTIEDKLPPSIRALWSLEVCDDTGDQSKDNIRFPHLLRFLLKHRRAIEYSSADIKPKKGVRITEAAVYHVQEEEEERPSKDDKPSDRRAGCWFHATNQ